MTAAELDRLSRALLARVDQAERDLAAALAEASRLRLRLAAARAGVTR